MKNPGNSINTRLQLYGWSLSHSPEKGCATLKLLYKRLLSLLLVFILTLGMFPTVMAATVEEDPDLPAPIEGYDPLDPDNPYPYGLPVTEYIPEDVLELINSGAMLMADDNQGSIPDEMWDNTILRALEYSGYDVQRQKDKGHLYQYLYITSRLKTNDPAVLSDIGYWDSGPCPNGDETVADSTTVTGKAPNISYFESNGLVCASFVTYFLCNYLPNIEGVDTSLIYKKAKELGMDSSTNYYYLTTVTLWKRTLDALSKDPNAGVTKYTDEDTAYDNLVPGDVVVFAKSDGSLVHIGIYAGEYNLYNGSTNMGLYHYMIHVGNSRGPEIAIIEWMSTSSGSKASEPVAFYHLDLNDQTDAEGYIEVKKADESGNALAGASFTAVDNATGTKYVIGPTNSQGYAKSEALPLSTYTVTETVFPSGYEASDTSTWTVTLTKDTPNMTITINAVNKLITGSLKIQKATNTGANLSGWKFGVYTDAACTKAISGSPFTTGADGIVAVAGLVPATYYVKELSGSTDFWTCDNGVKTVKVTGNSTATVTVTNTHYGYAKIVKQTNTGNNLAGWKFNIYSDAACTKLVSGSPFTTGEEGTIAVKLLPGDYYVVEVDESSQHPDWVYDTTVQKVTVKAGDTGTVTFSNNQLGKAQIVKAMPDGGSVAGWEFEVYRVSDNTLIGTFITGADGTILTGYIEPGEYRIYEKIPEDSIYCCETPNPQTVTVAAGATASVTFTNRIKPGKISVHKVDNTGSPRAGAEFLLEWSEDGEVWLPVVYSDSPHVTKGGCSSAGLTNGKLTSGMDGLVIFEGLHPELQYRLTETKAPDGLQLLGGYAYEGGLPIDKELTVELTVVNVPVFTMPETGSKSFVLTAVSLCLCLAGCAGALVYLRRKEG